MGMADVCFVFCAATAIPSFRAYSLVAACRRGFHLPSRTRAPSIHFPHTHDHLQFERDGTLPDLIPFISPFYTPAFTHTLTTTRWAVSTFLPGDEGDARLFSPPPHQTWGKRVFTRVALTAWRSLLPSLRNILACQFSPSPHLPTPFLPPVSSVLAFTAPLRQQLTKHGGSNAARALHYCVHWPVNGKTPPPALRSFA